MKESVWKKYELIEELSVKISVDICETGEDLPIGFCQKSLADMYFLGNDDKHNPVKGKQISRQIENAMDLIRKKEKWDCRDVFRILAWKLGKINHVASNEANKGKKIATRFIYQKGWSRDDADEHSLQIQLPNSAVIRGNDFIALSNVVINLRAAYQRKEKTPEAIWNELVEFASNEKMNGLGTVYLVTLLYFVTNGDKPIFDRFAMASLVVKTLEEKGIKVNRDSVIRGCNLPPKKEKKGKNLLVETNEYTQYCSLLEKFFPNETWKDRDVDRALWVYGHYFQVP